MRNPFKKKESAPINAPKREEEDNKEDSDAYWEGTETDGDEEDEAYEKNKRQKETGKEKEISTRPTNSGERVVIHEREINLSSINEKLNIIISMLNEK